MKAKSGILCLFICFLCIQSGAQTLFVQSDARSAGMGNPVTVLSDYHACHSNPAGIASVRSFYFGLYYTNYYGAGELGSGSVALLIPARPGNFSLSFTTAGYNVLTENQATFAYGMHLGKKFRAGIGIHWLVYNQPAGYRDLYAWIPSLGIQWLPSDKFVAGIMVRNPARQEYIPSGYRHIPSAVAAGISFKPSEEFMVLFEAEQNGGENICYILGFEASAGKSFSMRFGINRQYFTTYSLGAGYFKSKVGIDLAVNHHPILGFSPSAGLGYTF